MSSSCCSVCEGPLDEPLVWQDGDQKFCALHSSHHGLSSVVGGSVGLIVDLEKLSVETRSARREVDALRDRLNVAAAQVPPSLTNNSPCLGLNVGDKTELVLARSADSSGARVEQQLVGSGGMLKLCEKSKETGVPVWSAPKGRLVAVTATLASTAGAPFHLRLEAEASEIQVWCRSVEALDSWLTWIKNAYPACQIQRIPAVGGEQQTQLQQQQQQLQQQNPNQQSSSRAALVRPSPSKPMHLSSHGSSQALSSSVPAQSPASTRSTFTLRQRLQKTKSRQSMDIDSPASDDTGYSSNSSVADSPVGSRRSSNASEPQVPQAKPLTHSGEDGSSSAEKKGPRGMFGWAKKLYDKAGDLRKEKDAKSVDVFMSTLEEIMADQEWAFPEAKVPVLMSMLAEEVVKRGGHVTEGIFRISASHSDVAEAIAGIKKVKNYDYKLSGRDPHIPAAIMKQWLRELPIPLFQDYFKCMEIAAISSESPEYESSLKGIVDSLSEVHRNCAMYLISFLSFLGGDPQRVAITKMPLANLALVFVPSFLRCPGNDVSLMLTNQPSEQRFVQSLVELGALGRFGPLPEFKPPTTDQAQ